MPIVNCAGLIDEFLLQSVDNKIRLFPCWPSERNASFNGLRAQGGFTVSADFVGGRVTVAIIESSAGRELKLLSPWRSICINGKKANIDPDGLVTLKTKSGDIYRFTED